MCDIQFHSNSKNINQNIKLMLYTCISMMLRLDRIQLQYVKFSKLAHFAKIVFEEIIMYTIKFSILLIHVNISVVHSIREKYWKYIFKIFQLPDKWNVGCFLLPVIPVYLPIIRYLCVNRLM